MSFISIYTHHYILQRYSLNPHLNPTPSTQSLNTTSLNIASHRITTQHITRPPHSQSPSTPHSHSSSHPHRSSSHYSSASSPSHGSPARPGKSSEQGSASRNREQSKQQQRQQRSEALPRGEVAEPGPGKRGSRAGKSCCRRRGRRGRGGGCAWQREGHYRPWGLKFLESGLLGRWVGIGAG
jgi:hypothetical protein